MKGTMLPFFHRAMQEDMGIIVLNPNVNSYFDEETSERKPIPYNDTPEKHVLYVWDRIISFTTAKDVLIIAYGEGGNHAKALIQAREGVVLNKLRAIAFTESQHTLSSDLSFGLSRVDSKATRDFLENHTLNWITSDLPIGDRDYVRFKAMLIMIGARRAVGLHLCQCRSVELQSRPSELDCNGSDFRLFPLRLQ